MTEKDNAARLLNEAAQNTLFFNYSTLSPFVVKVCTDYLEAKKKHDEVLKAIPALERQTAILKEMMLSGARVESIGALIERSKSIGMDNEKKMIQVLLECANFTGEFSVKRGMA